MSTAETWKWAAPAKPQPSEVFRLKQLLEQQWEKIDFQKKNRK